MGLIFLRNRVSGAAPADAYAIGGVSPELVASFLTQEDGTTEGEYFRTGGATDDFTMFTFARSGSAWYFNSSGVLTEATSGNARRNAYYHNGTSWVKGGLQLESAAATQLLHGTDSFATQTETVTAQAYTLQFRGTGSIVLTGAHSATLSGTGANDLVSLTFTPSAGTLTLTPLGTVDYPQLEVGRIPTSYIPNPAGSGTVTRAAETLSVAGADTPANTTAMTISMKGLLTYADKNNIVDYQFLGWESGQIYIQWYLNTLGAKTGNPWVRQDSGVPLASSNYNSVDVYSPGVNVPFSIATRHTADDVQMAADGTAFAEGTDAGSLADLSAVPVLPFTTTNGFISEFRMWGADIGGSGIVEVTS